MKTMKGRDDMNWSEHPDQHFERTLVRSPVAASVCAVAVALMIAWILVSVDVPALRASLSAAVAVAASCSILAGNAFRLADVRKRRAYRLRRLADGDPEREAGWAQLVPPRTIVVRLVLATAGALIGIVTFGGNLWLAGGEIAPALVLTVCLLGAVTCTVCAVAGTFIRPFD